MLWRLIASFTFLYWFHVMNAQTYTVKGKVTDKDTKDALAFVNISFDGSNKGIVSNIDGVFVIESTVPLKQLTFSYVGYKTLYVSLSPENHFKELHIALAKKDIELTPVIVKPGENPAYRIIKKVLENKNRNNPEKMRSFSYTSYNKMYFTLQEDTTLHRRKPVVHIDSLAHDTLDSRINKYLKRQHLLLMEFVSERYFKHPDKNSERVVSSRVSGFSDPSFALLGTQMQSFSFYDNMVTLLEKQYLNPISPGSAKKYFFLLEDTFITETYDTLFVISYRPKRGSKFEGLQGLLYVNTNGYALQNVIAEPAQNTDRFAIRIQQKYELIDRKQWFPTQLNTDLLFKSSKIKTKQRELFPVGIGKSYLSNIKLEPDLSNIKFTNIEVEVANNAHKQTDSTWYSYRASPLTTKDSSTYRLIDSIGKAQLFDQKLKIFEAIMSGYIPVKILNIDYRKFLGYNEYEGLRLGLGVATNHKVSQFFSLGGYIAYGIYDKTWKYSSFLQLFPSWVSETKLTFKHSNDVWETAKYSFLSDYSLSSSEWFRDFLVSQMDFVDEDEVSLSFRALRYVKLNLYLNQSRKKIAVYQFVDNRNSTTTLRNNFNFSELGIEIKFGFK